MPAAAYGWAAVLLALIGFFIWLRWAIRRGASVEAELERETRARLDAERKADEHKQVADVRGRDLGPSPGFRVRRKDKRSGDDTPPGSA